MELLEYFDFQKTLTILSTLFGGGGLLYAYQERKKRILQNRSTEVNILDQLQEFLKDDIEQVHRVNDVLKFRIQELESELKKYRDADKSE